MSVDMFAIHKPCMIILITLLSTVFFQMSKCFALRQAERAHMSLQFIIVLVIFLVLACAILEEPTKPCFFLFCSDFDQALLLLWCFCA